MKDAKNALANIAKKITADQELQLNKEIIGEDLYTALSELFVQEDFTITGCALTSDAESTTEVSFFGTFTELTFLHEIAMEGVFFNLKTIPPGKKKEVEQLHFIFKIALPEKLETEDHTDDEAQDKEDKKLNADVFLQAYRANANSMESGQELKETVLDIYLNKIDFTQREMIFSSLDYQEEMVDFYPAAFSKYCKSASLKCGLNFPVKPEISSSVLDFIASNIHIDLNDLKKAITCHAVISHSDGQNNFTITPPVTTSRTLGPLTLTFNSINISFALTGDDAMLWPDITLTGSANNSTATLLLNLYNKQLTITFTTFPTLRDLFGDALNDYFPGPLSILTDITLSKLEMLADGSDKSIAYIELELTTSQEIALFKDIIKVKPSVSLFIEQPFNAEERTVYGTLSGSWSIGGKEIITTIAYPDMDIIAMLGEDEKLEAGTLISKLLPSGFDLTLDITQLQLNGNFRESHFSFATEASTRIALLPGSNKLMLEGISTKITYHNPATVTDGSAIETSLAAQLKLGDVAATVTAHYETEYGLQLTASTGEDEQIPVHTILNDLLEHLSLPKGIPTFNVSNINLYAAPRLEKYTFDAIAELKLSSDLSINITEFSASREKAQEEEAEEKEAVEEKKKQGKKGTKIKSDKKKPVIAGTIKGNIKIGKVTIDLSASLSNDNDSQTTEKTFTGSTSNLDISVKELIEGLWEKLPFEKPAIPSGLLPDVNMKDIFVTYNSEEKETNLIALVTVKDHEVRFFFQYQGAKKAEEEDAQESRYVLGVLTNIGGLGNMPMVGEQLKNVTITNTGFIYASTEGKYNLPEITTDGDKKSLGKAKEVTELKDALHIVSLLSLPEKKQIILPLKKKKKADTPVLKSVGISATALALQANEDTHEPATKQERVEKKIGPLTITQYGFSYKNGEATLLISASLKLGPLDISTEGLGLGFNVGSLLKMKIDAPTFSLKGLGLKYESSPIEISGMFLRTDKENANPEYTGAALIKAASFNVSGIGSYSTTSNGKASFFIYAAYFGPIGGPAFFFVTGIAAGFGFNRKVIVPSVEKVADFPLVSIALSTNKNKGVKDVLNDLIRQDAIAVSEGDYWLAAGIKFTSFKIIDAFVLLIVQFGNKTEFTIVGLAVLAWPDKKNPIAYVELALLARFGPGSDVIAVQAVITPNSFVFDKGCRLTGGFAFYAWVSGPHEGDFVVTLGGYHPAFKKPDHYPTVDRLALNWKMDHIPLTMRGEMYYALTPSAIMAGGRWEVAYDLSFLKASIIIWADMIISWAPFYYRLDAGVRVKIEARIKILFVKIYFSLEMGAELHIWGPPFAGYIFVDWSIFSFRIPFGDQRTEEQKHIDWKAFSDSFIPSREKDAALLRNNNGELPANPLEARISAGIIAQYTINKETITIVNPYELELSTESFIPSTKMTTRDANARNIEISNTAHIESADSIIPITYEAYKKKEPLLGIKPVGITQLDSAFTAWVERIENNRTTSVFAMNYSCTAKGVADALWGTTEFDRSKVPESRIIPGVLSGMKFTPVEEADTHVQTIKLSTDSYVNVGSGKKEIPFVTNRNALRAEDPETKITAGIRNITTRRTVAAQLQEAGLSHINTGTKLMHGKGELDFVQQPMLVSITRKINIQA
jgi:hypothetical protein